MAAETSNLTALSLLCQPQHINCWTVVIHTTPSIFDTPTHSFSSSYSSTFPVPLKDLPLLLIMGVGREQQHTQNICGGQRAACRSEFSPSTEGPRTAKQATLPTELPLFMFLCSKISLVCHPHFQLNTSNSSPSLLKPFLKVSKPLAPLTN